MQNSDLEMLNYIDELIASNDIDTSLKLLNKFSLNCSQEEFKNYLFAVCYLRKPDCPDYKLSIEYLDKIKLDNETIRYLRLYNMFCLKDYEEIIEYYIVNQRKNYFNNYSVINLDALSLIALSYEKMNLFKGAKKIYTLILNLAVKERQLSNDNVDNNTYDNKNLSQNYDIKLCLNNLIGLYLKNNEIHDAYEIYKEYDINMFNLELCNNLAINLIKLKKHEEGIELFENILTRNDEFTVNQDIKAKILNNYVNQLINLKQFDKALNVLKDNYLEDTTGIQVLMYSNLIIKDFDNPEEGLNILRNYYNLYSSHNGINLNHDSNLSKVLELIKACIDKDYEDKQLNNSNIINNNRHNKEHLNNNDKPNNTENAINNAPDILTNNVQEINCKPKYNYLVEEKLKTRNNSLEKNTISEDNKFNNNSQSNLLIDKNCKDFNIKISKESDSNLCNQNYIDNENDNSNNVNSLNNNFIKLVDNDINAFTLKTKESIIELEDNSKSKFNLYENEKDIKIKFVKEDVLLDNNNNYNVQKLSFGGMCAENTKDNNKIINDVSNNVFFNSFKDNNKEVVFNDSKLNININDNNSTHLCDSIDKKIEELNNVYIIDKSNKTIKKDESFSNTITLGNSLLSKNLSFDHKYEVSFILFQVFYELEDYNKAACILFPFYKRIINSITNYNNLIFENTKEVKLLVNTLNKCNNYYDLKLFYEEVYISSKEKEYLWNIVKYSTLSNLIESTKEYSNIILNNVFKNNNYSVNLIKVLKRLIEIIFDGNSDFNAYLDELITLFKKNLDSKDDGNSFYYFCGRYDLRTKQYNSAYEYFIRLENDLEYTNNSKYYKLFAKTCLKLKNTKKAIKLYKYALKLNNLDFESCINIGEAYLKHDNIEGANKYLNFCKNLEANNEEKNKLYFILGRLMYKQKSYKQAISYFEKSIKLDNQSYKAYYNIALIYIELNELDKAKENLLKCIGINSSYLIASFELYSVELLELNNSKDENINKKKEIINNKFKVLIDKIPLYYIDYSKILIDYFESFKEAADYINSYINKFKNENNKDFNFYKTFETISYLLLNSDLYKECFELYNNLIKNSVKEYRLYYKICNNFSKVKKYNYCIKALKDYVSDNPHEFEALSNLAYYYLLDNKIELATKYYQDSEELFSIENKYNGFLKGLAYCYLDKGLYDKAYLEMDKHHAKQAEENNFLILAVILYLKGEDKEGDNMISKEKSLFSSNLNISKYKDNKCDLMNNWRALFKYV